MQQRVGTITLSREFFARLMLEDSCHYILYSVLFLTSTPVTMALLPIFIFSGLQAAAFAVSFGNGKTVNDRIVLQKLRARERRLRNLQTPEDHF